MTLDEIRAMDKPCITPAEAGQVLGLNPQSIRIMAHTDPAALGYPVSCPSPHRTQIPRIPFLRFWEGANDI